MDLRFSSDAWEDYHHWLVRDRTVRRLNAVIKDARRSSYAGTGKPEALKGNLSGWWSRRITEEHRIVYRVTGQEGEQVLEIAACRHHY